VIKKNCDIPYAALRNSLYVCAMTRSIRFTRIVTMTDQLASHLQRLHFSGFQTPDVTWQPAVNMYVYPDRLDVCVELAGVNKEDIKVDVSPRRLVISGHRLLPGTGCKPPSCDRILMMEIADGIFERSLELPLDVETQRVEARQDNGWLWITLPKALPQPLP
jgi:HSP20 family protein